MQKTNDLPLSFLCESHSQAIKIINCITCNVSFNTAKKHVNNQVRQEVVEQFKQGKESGEEYNQTEICKNCFSLLKFKL